MERPKKSENLDMSNRFTFSGVDTWGEEYAKEDSIRAKIRNQAISDMEKWMVWKTEEIKDKISIIKDAYVNNACNVLEIIDQVDVEIDQLISELKEGK